MPRSMRTKHKEIIERAEGLVQMGLKSKDALYLACAISLRYDYFLTADPANCPPGHQTGDPISPSTGYTSNALQRLTSVAIDSSGKVWVPNN